MFNSVLKFILQESEYIPIDLKNSFGRIIDFYNNIHRINGVAHENKIESNFLS